MRGRCGCRRMSAAACRTRTSPLYLAAGIRAFGLGSSLYRERALASVSAYDHAVTKASG